MMRKHIGKRYGIFFIVAAVGVALNGCGGTVAEHGLATSGRPAGELARIYSNPDPFIEQVNLQVGPNKAAGSWQNRPMVFNSAFDGSGTVIIDAGVAHLVKLFCRGRDGGIFNPGMYRSPARYFAVTPAPDELITFSLLNSRNPHPNPDCNVVASSASAVQIDAQEAEKMLAWIEAGRPTATSTPPPSASTPAPAPQNTPVQEISAPGSGPAPVKENVVGKVLD